MAVCKALLGSKGSLQHLELDENEISENGIDQVKVPFLPFPLTSSPFNLGFTTHVLQFVGILTFEQT